MTFPAYPGAPGAVPGGLPGGQMAPSGMPAAGQPFVLQIPPDLTWTPFTTTDNLDKDGFYCCRITSEEYKTINESPRVVISLEVMDPDAAGKKLARLLPDPRTTQKQTWFLWRGLLMSVYSLDAARQGLTYTPGQLVGQFAYVKTAAYPDDGNMRTGIDAWSTKQEWEEAVKAGRHRWAIRVPANAGGGVGALPGGLPGGLPGAGLPGAPSAGLPGLPGAALPGLPTATPQPAGAPMQQAPQLAVAPPIQPAGPPPPSFAPSMLPGAAPQGFVPPANGSGTPQPAPTFRFPGT